MKIKKYLLLSSVTVFFINTLSQNNYRSVHWDVEHGLSNGIVSCMIKDVNGFLWMGTSYGLNRFDGSTFKNYFAEEKSKHTIPDNNILKLIEDSLHNIWIGSPKGLSRYNIRADTFTTFLSASTDNFNKAIIPFSATNEEVYCIEGNSAITAFNIHSLAKRNVMKLIPTDYVQDGVSILHTFFDAGSNSVWMLEGKSGMPGGGLYQIYLSNGKREHYQWPCYRNIQNHSHWSEAMGYDKKRNAIWINSPDGLIEFALRDKKFHSVDALREVVNLKSYNRLVGLDIDPNGRVLFASKPKGIIVYDPSSQSVTFPVNGDSILQNKISDGNLSLHCDKDGIIWLGFYYRKGVYQLNPFSETVKQYSIDNKHVNDINTSILNCVNGGKGLLWMGTLNGLSIFNSRTGLFQVLKEKDLPGLRGNIIIPAGLDTITQKAWLHTEKGVFEMNILTRKCYPVVFKDRAYKEIQHLHIVDPLLYGGYCQYKNGCIMPAFIDGQLGFFLIKSDSAIAHQILKFPGNITLYGTANGNDRLLFLQAYDETTQTYSDYGDQWIQVHTGLDSIKRKKIIWSKKDSSYWIMAENGLYHFNKDFQFLHKYNQKDGLPFIELFGAVADNNGDIWFITDRSISKLNRSTGKITTLTESEGFQKQFFSPGACIVKGNDGDLYFMSGVQGGPGFARVMPDRLRKTYPPSTAYFKSLKVNQNASSLSIPTNSLAKLSLKYFENNISIETGVIDYYSKGTNRIRYKLEGLNNNWQYAPAKYVLHYAGLSPGGYKLIIQASNAADEFNGPAKELQILINTPFWKSWWFISLVAITAAIAVFILFRFRLNQKMKVLFVRQKLHQDLHDDLGATLSTVKVYSELLQSNTNNSLITELIKSNSEEMIEKLEIIAWSTNPQHDTFKSLKELMLNAASPLCHAKNIRFEIQCERINENMIMPGEVRQNIFLIFKEAFNNMIKYSEASACNVHLSIRNRKFYFIITDNGKGFSNETKRNGAGWKNMTKRAEYFHGEVIIESIKDKGTIITVRLPYPFKIPNFWGKDKRNL